MSRILAIDDEAEILELLGEYARHQGWSIDTTTDSETALAWLKSQSYQVVICDIRMPGCDGIELLRRFREQMPRQQN